MQVTRKPQEETMDTRNLLRQVITNIAKVDPDIMKRYGSYVNNLNAQQLKELLGIISKASPTDRQNVIDILKKFNMDYITTRLDQKGKEQYLTLIKGLGGPELMQLADTIARAEKVGGNNVVDILKRFEIKYIEAALGQNGIKGHGQQIGRLSEENLRQMVETISRVINKTRGKERYDAIQKILQKFEVVEPGRQA